MVAWSLVISLMFVLISKSQTQDAAFNCFRRYTLIELVPNCFLSSVVGNTFSKPDREEIHLQRRVTCVERGDGEGDAERIFL